MKHLTVIIYDGTPVVCANEPCSHRRVTFPLTPDQEEALALRNDYEGFATFLIEDIKTEEPPR